MSPAESRTGREPETSAATVGAVSDCPACREQTPEGARFCPSCGTPLGVAGNADAERKVVTTLFADLVDFTGLGER